MHAREFDKFADEYEQHHNKSINFSGDTSSFFSEYKIKEIRRQISLENMDSKLLDFGCGIGNSLPFLIKFFPQSKVHLLDISQKSLAIAEKRFPSVGIFKWLDGNKIPFEDNSFDIVFSSCVFHHIPPEEHNIILLEIFRVLKKNGTFFVFEHNPYNPLTQKAVRDCVFDENAILIKASTLSARLKDVGFSANKIRYTYFFPQFLKIFRSIERFLFWLPMGGQYYIASKK